MATEYDDETRQDVVDDLAEAFADAIADGDLFFEKRVYLVKEEFTGANPDLYEPGTKTDVLTEIEPRPEVIIKDQFRTINGIAHRVGDAKIEIIRKNVQKSDLISSSYILVGQDKYTLVKGSILEEPFTIVAILKKDVNDEDPS